MHELVPRIKLGSTGITIPPLFIGTGSWDFKQGCKQEYVNPTDYAPVLKRAYEAGINFWDTSDDYHTHPHVRLGMQNIPRENLVIATKTYASTASLALDSLEKSLAELETGYADIFHLHSVDSMEGYEKRIADALPGLQNAKQTGKIYAIGLSTHNIHVLEKAVEHPGLDVIFTNFNKCEVHMDASLEWYSRCLKRAHENGKGVLVMKTLGEGALHDRAKEVIEFNLSQPFIHSVCVGIASLRELEEMLGTLPETLNKTSEARVF